LCFPCTFVRACYAIESINNSKIDTKRKAKNPIKAHGWNHHTEDKREGQREAKRWAASKNQRREIPAKPLTTGYPPVEAHVQLLPQARGAYFRNILFHRLYLKVPSPGPYQLRTLPTSHKTSLFSGSSPEIGSPASPHWGRGLRLQFESAAYWVSQTGPGGLCEP